jgi:hypothetical protein
MALRPEVSLPTALATGAIVYVTYDHALPSIADARVGGCNDDHLSRSERQAAWTSAAIVGAISLIAKDSNVFIVGGGMIILLSWWHRHANAVNPDSGKVAGASPVRTPDMYNESY